VLFDHDVPVVPADAVSVREVDELAVAAEADVETAVTEWESRAEQRRREAKAARLDRIISEHRAGTTLPESEE